MKANQSPLILEEVFIIASNIVSVPEEKDSINEVNDFDIDVDFDIFYDSDDDDHHKVVVSVSGNDVDKPVAGYCFSIVAQGVFNFNKNADLDKKNKDILLSRSAIPMVIGQIRSYLSSCTAHGPFGLYLLPAIDMNALLESKSNKEEK